MMYLQPNTLFVCMQPFFNPCPLFQYIYLFVHLTSKMVILLNSNVLFSFYLKFSFAIAIFGIASNLKTQGRKNAHVKFLSWTNRFLAMSLLGVFQFGILTVITRLSFVVCFFCSSRKAEMKERHDEIRKKYGKSLTLFQIYSV